MTTCTEYYVNCLQDEDCRNEVGLHIQIQYIKRGKCVLNVSGYGS